jgi:hypothetical protein
VLWLLKANSTKNNQLESKKIMFLKTFSRSPIYKYPLQIKRTKFCKHRSLILDGNAKCAIEIKTTVVKNTLGEGGGGICELQSPVRT